MAFLYIALFVLVEGGVEQVKKIRPLEFFSALQAIEQTQVGIYGNQCRFREQITSITNDQFDDFRNIGQFERASRDSRGAKKPESEEVKVSSKEDVLKGYFM